MENKNSISINRASLIIPLNPAEEEEEEEEEENEKGWSCVGGDIADDGDEEIVEVILRKTNSFRKIGKVKASVGGVGYKDVNNDGCAYINYNDDDDDEEGEEEDVESEDEVVHVYCKDKETKAVERSDCFNFGFSESQWSAYSEIQHSLWKQKRTAKTPDSLQEEEAISRQLAGMKTPGVRCNPTSFVNNSNCPPRFSGRATPSRLSTPGSSAVPPTGEHVGRPFAGGSTGLAGSDLLKNKDRTDSGLSSENDPASLNTNFWRNFRNASREPFESSRDLPSERYNPVRREVLASKENGQNGQPPPLSLSLSLPPSRPPLPSPPLQKPNPYRSMEVGARDRVLHPSHVDDSHRHGTTESRDVWKRLIPGAAERSEHSKPREKVAGASGEPRHGWQVQQTGNKKQGHRGAKK